MTRVRTLALTTAALLLKALPLVAAHGDHHDDAPMDMHMEAPQPQVEASGAPQSYWSLFDHAALMYWHIGLEILAWVVILPVGKWPSSSPI